MFMGFDGFMQPGFFEVGFFLIFAIVLGVMIFMLIKGIATWNKNNHSPRLSVRARVSAKWEDVTWSQHGGNMAGAHMNAQTWYYATFEVESGDRIEFSVSDEEYSMLSEGDVGTLTFQGTRYLSFERD